MYMYNILVNGVKNDTHYDRDVQLYMTEISYKHEDRSSSSHAWAQGDSAYLQVQS